MPRELTKLLGLKAGETGFNRLLSLDTLCSHVNPARRWLPACSLDCELTGVSVRYARNLSDSHEYLRIDRLRRRATITVRFTNMRGLNWTRPESLFKRVRWIKHETEVSYTYFAPNLKSPTYLFPLNCRCFSTDWFRCQRVWRLWNCYALRVSSTVRNSREKVSEEFKLKLLRKIFELNIRLLDRG